MPSTTPTTEPMSAERSGLLAEFARACKAAARAVSLYPGAHPAIGGSLSRLVSAAGRLTSDGRVVCAVHPDMPVSYTHLRAHETGRNLVCRLLLEKKKK